MMDDPVAKASSISTKRNSFVFHKISSSQKRERCIMQIDAAERYSNRKSRSDTPSRLFMLMREKPSSSATRSRLSG